MNIAKFDRLLRKIDQEAEIEIRLCNYVGKITVYMANCTKFELLFNDVTQLDECMKLIYADAVSYNEYKNCTA